MAKKTGQNNIGKFFRGVWAELKKVAWPNRREITVYTIVVIVTVLVVSVLIGVFDALINMIFSPDRALLMSGGLVMEKAWYVIHTYSGYENKVKANLERRVDSMGMEDKIFRVLVPMEEEFEYKDGKRKMTKKKIYPGYVIVEMIMTDDSWYVVRNTPGVTGFVGSGTKPLPLHKREIDLILHQMGMDEPRPRINFEIGESVRVTRGPFENFSGSIEEINPEKGKLKVMVSMFGRETPVELEYNQVTKI